MSVPKKPVNLRAFKLINSGSTISQNPRTVLSMFSDKLSGSIASNRKMLLNQDDPSEEADMLTNYSFGTGHIFGTMFRVLKSENVNIFPESLMQQEIISMDDIFDLEGGNSVIKSQYYFFLDDNFLITNFYHAGEIYPFETYLNWLLNDIRAGIINIVPHVVPPPDVKLTDIKEVKISDSFINRSIDVNRGERDITETVNISASIARQLLSDTSRLSETELERIIVAELKVRFRKPAGMSADDYKERYGALLKPMADLDSIKFITKKGTQLSGQSVVKTKRVMIETTQSGKLSEPYLSQEMERFLAEIYEENNS